MVIFILFKLFLSMCCIVVFNFINILYVVDGVGLLVGVLFSVLYCVDVFVMCDDCVVIVCRFLMLIFEFFVVM